MGEWEIRQVYPIRPFSLSVLYLIIYDKKLSYGDLIIVREISELGEFGEFFFGGVTKISYRPVELLISITSLTSLTTHSP